MDIDDYINGLVKENEQLKHKIEFLEKKIKEITIEKSNCLLDKKCN